MPFLRRRAGQEPTDGEAGRGEAPEKKTERDSCRRRRSILGQGRALAASLMFLFFVPFLSMSFRRLEVDTADGTKRAIERSKPSFYFHVGPPKTATTTLQVGLWRLRDRLAADGYSYEGKSKNDPQEEEVRSFYRRLSKTFCRRAPCRLTTSNGLDDFLREVEVLGHRTNGSHVVVSDEAFAFSERVHRDWDAVLAALRPTWDVRFVVAYRRYDEWLPSAVAEMRRETYRTKRTPEDCNDAASHLAQLRSKVGDGPDASESGIYKYQYADEAAEKFRRLLGDGADGTTSSDDVLVLDMHSDPDSSLMTKFVCDVLPDARGSCAESARRDRRERNKLRKNAKPDFAYDHVACAAARRGWVDAARPEVVRGLRDFHRTELGGTRLPRACLGREELEAILNRSWTLRRAILGPDATTGEEAFRGAFWDKVANAEGHEYCTADVDALFREQPEWEAYLRGTFGGTSKNETGTGG